MGQKRNHKEKSQNFQMNKNENGTYQKMLNPAKAVLTGKLIAVNA